MGRLSNRLRVLDARIAPSRVYRPPPPSAVKSFRVGAVVGCACAAGSILSWPNHRVLSLILATIGYVAVNPWLRDQVLRRNSHPHLRRLLWVMSLPVTILLWLLRYAMDRSFTGDIAPGEKVRAVAREGRLSADGGGWWIVSDKAVYIWPAFHPDESRRSDGYRISFYLLRSITEEPLDASLVRRVLRVWPEELHVEDQTMYEGIFDITRGPSKLVDLIRAGILAAERGQTGDRSDEG